jgi:predicted nucleic acid-binding protein
MKSILIDTDVLINFLRGRESAREFLTSSLGEADLCCSAVTVAEIHAGMKEHERERTEELLDSLTVLEVTREIAEKAGTYKRTIKSQGLALDDCLVAATAFVKHAVLATGNDRHYPMAEIKKTVVAG